MIENIKLPKKEEELSGVDKSMIEKYKRDTHITYSTLQTLNRRANVLLAIPITDNDSNVWGVLIIDNIKYDAKATKSLKDQLDTFIDKYQNIFSLTLSLIKK